MRELRSRSKKLNGKYNEKTGAELPHNNAYFITSMMSYLGGFKIQGSKYSSINAAPSWSFKRVILTGCPTLDSGNGLFTKRYRPLTH